MSRGRATGARQVGLCRAEPGRAGPGSAGLGWAGLGCGGRCSAPSPPARPGERHSRSRPAAQLLLPSHGNRPLWEVTSRRAQPIPDPSFKSAPPFPRFPGRDGFCGGPGRGWPGTARPGWAPHGRYRPLRRTPPPAASSRPAPTCAGGCAAARSPPLPPARFLPPRRAPAAPPLGWGRGEQHPCIALHLQLTSLSPSSALPSLLFAPFPSLLFPSPHPFSPSLSPFPWPFPSPHLFPFHPFSFRIPDSFSHFSLSSPCTPHAAYLSHTFSSPSNPFPSGLRTGGQPERPFLRSQTRGPPVPRRAPGTHPRSPTHPLCSPFRHTFHYFPSRFCYFLHRFLTRCACSGESGTYKQIITAAIIRLKCQEINMIIWGA
ncbi:uncharacterized protein [Anomalospiza imberbis]|uniref:uncharacterized protein n=1 Tax=Anomalospiza imberbis TaxID=187417 RepID=UPI00358FA9B5